MSYASLRAHASLAALLAGLGTAAAAQTPQIVADIPVSHALTAIVTQGVTEPVLILDRGADPHHFAMRPSQARAVAQAGLAVWMGPEMTPWMGRAVEGLGTGATLTLLQAEGLRLQPYRPQMLTGAAAEAAEEYAHDHSHGHDEHGHDEHGHDDHGHSHDEHGHDDHGHSHDEHGHDDHGHSHDEHGHDDHGHSHDEHGHDDHGHSHDEHGHDDHGHSHDEHGHDDHGHSHDEHGHDDHGHSHDEHGHDEHGHDDHGHSHDEHGHDDHGHSHDEHGHDHSDGAADPHAWMQIHNAKTWLDAIAAQLAALDPANADAYRANAAAGRAELVELRAEIAGILAPVGDAGLVMYHDAYGYLASEFGLNILGSITLGDAAAPGAARLSAIRASLEESGAVCIFPEVNHPDAFVTLATEGSSLRIGAPLDPEGVMLDPGPDLYANLMRQMAEAIADCVTADRDG